MINFWALYSKRRRFWETSAYAKLLVTIELFIFAVLIVTIGIGAVVLVSDPVQSETERWYQVRLCEGMKIETILPHGRVDCESRALVIEVDWTRKWHEAIGQSLLYASDTGKRPGVILICKQTLASCRANIGRFVHAVKYWRLPIVGWSCAESARTLADCQELS